MIAADTKTSLTSRFTDCLQKHPERTAVVEPSVQSSLQRDCVWSYSDVASLSAKISCEIQYILLERSSLLEDNGEEKRRRRPSTEGLNEKADTANCAVIIGICMPRSVEYVAAVLAVMKVGAAFVPLDTSWPLARLQQVCNDCKPAIILTRIEIVEDSASAQLNLSSRILRVPRMESFLASVEMEKWRDANFWAKETSASQMGRSFLYVMYTSGSTGQPKGVCGTESGLMQRLQWMEKTYPFGEDDVACFKTSISFIDHLTELLGPLLCGVRVIIPPQQHLERNASHLFSYLEAYKVTRLTAVPSLLQVMVIFLEQNKPSSLPTTMKVVVSSGEALRWSLFQHIQSHLPKAVILNLYGSTEVSGDCTCLNVSEASTRRKFGSMEVDHFETSNHVPIGKAIEGSFVRILDEQMQPVSVGQEGELFIGGAGLAHSYLNNTIETEDKFPLVDMTSETSDTTPEAPANSIRNLKRTYRTGDLARELPDGNIALLGRRDLQVKIHGVRVELGEVESTLSLHPAVVHAAVLAWPREGDSPLIAAYVVLRRNLAETGGAQPSSEETKSSVISTEQEKALETDREEEREMEGGASLDGGGERREKSFEKELREWLGERLLKAMVPTWVVVLGESSWPWTASGKVDRASFQEPDWTLQQEPCKGPQKEHVYADKQHQDLTERIQKVMGEVLGVLPLHPHTDFFTSGGSSVTAAQMAHELGIGMDVLYANPTPSLLSAALLRHPTLSNTSRGALSLKRSRSQDDHEQSSPDNISQCHKREKLCLSALQDTEEAHDSNSKKDMRGEDLDSNLQRKSEENQSSSGNAAEECVAHGVDNFVLAKEFCDGEGVAFMRANRTISVGEIAKGERQSERYVCVHSEGVDSLEPAMAAGTLGGVGLDDGGAGSSGVQLRERWKARLGSCVDASPLVVCRGEAVRVYVGSHAHNFCCFDGSDGKLLWETKVGGRVEATAGITLNGMHVVVGCYDGNIYFLDAGTGELVWEFSTGAEVKCQPVADTWHGLIWCGSHDHCLYALDAEKRECRFKYNCGGSLFGAPAIHHARRRVYVATTKGEVLAFSCEGEFRLLWCFNIGSPIFGSVAVKQESGGAVICSVDGKVSAFDVEGQSLWKFMCSGPIFAGATLSDVLPGQVVVCSRDGSAYGIALGEGSLLWKYATGSPITASAFAFGDAARKRYTCVCSSSGGIHIVRIEAGEGRCGGQSQDVEEVVIDGVGELQLRGDVFSSPVVHGSDIYVGCRDDHLYCINVAKSSASG